MYHHVIKLLHDLDPSLVLKTGYSQMQVNITSTSLGCWLQRCQHSHNFIRFLLRTIDAISSVQFLDVALLLDGGGELPVSPDQPGQQPHVGGEEGEALQPDEHEGVVTLQHQHIICKLSGS